jgi:hypothetical protein
LTEHQNFGNEGIQGNFQKEMMGALENQTEWNPSDELIDKMTANEEKVDEVNQTLNNSWIGFSSIFDSLNQLINQSLDAFLIRMQKIFNGCFQKEEAL